MQNKTIREAYQEASSFLKQKGIEDAFFEAEWMFRELVGVDRASFFLMWDEPLSEEQVVLCQQWVERRASHEPLQYIFGKADFYGRSFKVTSDVLIPRPETELLVEHVLHLADDLFGSQSINLVDIGTGSGCIPITFQLERAHWLITSIDLSECAIAIAKRNAKYYNLADEIIFRQGSYLEPVQHDSVQVIVSNPPYIPSEVVLHLDDEVKKYEPHLALDGGPDGLAPYREITKQVKKLSSVAKRLIAFEIGDKQGKVVADLVKQIPSCNWVEVRQDLNGRDRYVFGLIEQG
jgi:release factor glutamine methyltransferase